jgi:YVTN family beta-propeller protein
MFRKLIVLSLLLMAFGCTSLNAQSIAYVTNFLDNTVSVIDTSTNTVTATIAVGNQPNGIVFSPDHTRAYVTNRGTTGRGTISVIDTASSTVVATLDVPGVVLPIFPGISPDGKTLYLPSEATDSVVVYDIASGTVRATISIPSEPDEVAITPDGRRGYVSTAAADIGSVWVFDTSTNTLIGSPIPVANGGFISRLRITPDGKHVYVSGGEGTTITVIDTATNTPLSISGVPSSVGLAIAPDGTRVYVPDFRGSALSIIDTATNAVFTDTIQVGGDPIDAAVSTDGAFVYVTNGNDNTVSVIATADNTVVATVPVGTLPFTVAAPAPHVTLPPTAVAGTNQTITVGQTVHLNGSGSFAPDTLPASLQYAWSFVAQPFGSSATLNGANTATPSFVADVPGNFIVQLVVTDPATNLSSDPSQVIISSIWSPPIANVSASAQSVTTGSVVHLNGLGSTDPNGLPLLTYAWDFISKPAGSAANVTPEGIGLASFTADVAGFYAVELVVSDRFGSSQPALAFITATTPENSEQLLQDAINFIAARPASHFDAPGHNNALTNHLQQAIIDIQQHKISQAIGKVQDAITRTDGFPLRGVLDGNGPGMDWIIDQNDQNFVYGKLTAALSMLQAM